MLSLNCSVLGYKWREVFTLVFFLITSGLREVLNLRLCIGVRIKYLSTSYIKFLLNKLKEIFILWLKCV